MIGLDHYASQASDQVKLEESLQQCKNLRDNGGNQGGVTLGVNLVKNIISIYGDIINIAPRHSVMTAEHFIASFCENEARHMRGQFVLAPPTRKHVLCKHCTRLWATRREKGNAATGLSKATFTHASDAATFELVKVAAGLSMGSSQKIAMVLFLQECPKVKKRWGGKVGGRNCPTQF